MKHERIEMMAVSTESIMAMVSDPTRSGNQPDWADPCQYGLAVRIVMSAKPCLNRSSAIRLLNAVLEIADPVF